MKSQLSDKKAFLKQCFRNPKSMGAIAPSSPALAEAMAKFTDYKPGQIIIEIGAGTGALTQGLLNSGVDPDSLYPIEIDDEMIEIFAAKFPKINIYKGDASKLDEILPSNIIGKADVVVSGVPLVNLKREDRKKIIYSCLDVLKDSGKILQFTYGLIAPIPYKKWGLKGKRLDYIVKNIPPAFIWEFSK